MLPAFLLAPFDRKGRIENRYIDGVPSDSEARGIQLGAISAVLVTNTMMVMAVLSLAQTPQNSVTNPEHPVAKVSYHGSPFQGQNSSHAQKEDTLALGSLR